MKERENPKAHLALLAANIIYGASYSIAKMVMPDYIKPLGFIVVRGIGAVILFWLCHALLMKEKVETRDFPKLAICAVFGIAVNQMLFFSGLNITTTINAGIIMTSTPILVVVAAAFMIREKISAIKITGIVLGLVGALLIIVMGKDFSFGSETLPGDLLILINATSFGVFLVIVKPLMKKYHPLTVMKWVFLFGMLMVLPFGYKQFLAIDWANMPLTIGLAVAYVVVFLTFLSYLLNSYALSRVSASTVSIYIYSQPVFATIIAIILGNDSLTPLKIIAAALIFTGVYLVSWGK